jgi:sRNA-binding carbon storage regulator CsrA
MNERLTTRELRRRSSTKEPIRLQVTVLEIHSGEVPLGFDVDSNVPAHRLKVWEQIPGRGNNPKEDRANGRGGVEE